MKKLLLYLVAIASGAPVFILFVLMFPGIEIALTQRHKATIIDTVMSVEALSVTVYVAVACTCFVGKMLNMEEFDEKEASNWRVISSFPLLFIGPLAVILLLCEHKILETIIQFMLLCFLACETYRLNKLQSTS